MMKNLRNNRITYCVYMALVLCLAFILTSCGKKEEVPEPGFELYFVNSSETGLYTVPYTLTGSDTEEMVNEVTEALKIPSDKLLYKNVIGNTFNLVSVSIKDNQLVLGFDAGYTVLGPKHLSGPVGIGKYLYISVYRGSLILGLNLVVLISFNLGLLNLMPIPVLDGGHVVLALLEMIFRRPVPAKVLQPIAYTFICILILFMLFVTFYDIKKLIPVPAADKAVPQEKTEQAPQNEKP